MGLIRKVLEAVGAAGDREEDDHSWAVVMHQEGREPHDIGDHYTEKSAIESAKRHLRDPEMLLAGPFTLEVVRDQWLDGPVVWRGSTDDPEGSAVEEAVNERAPQFRGKPRVTPEGSGGTGTADVLILVKGSRAVFDGRREVAARAIEAIKKALGDDVEAVRVKPKGM